jgi:hypothetical protein
VSFFARRKGSTRLAATPTVVALGAEISALCEGLPRDVRASVADLPRLVLTLEREADAVRASAGDLGDARIAAIATALEAMRVELLSLRAGVGTVEGVTTALEHARAKSERVDRALMESPQGSRSPRLERTPTPRR